MPYIIEMKYCCKNRVSYFITMIVFIIIVLITTTPTAIFKNIFIVISAWANVIIKSVHI